MPKQEFAEISATEGAVKWDEHLEWLIATSCVHSYPVFCVLKEKICPPLLGAADAQGSSEMVFRHDFIEPIYNDLWPAIHRYWKTMSMAAMSVRRGQPWPGLWKECLFSPGVHRSENVETKLWAALSQLIAQPASPLDMESLQDLTKSSSFVAWRVKAASRAGHIEIVNALQANQHYSPDAIANAAKSIEDACRFEFTSFKNQVAHVMKGERPVQGLPIPTGISELDADFCGGFPPDALVLVGGFTGGGKTVASVQMGLEAVNAGIPTLLITTEIQLSTYITRMVSNKLNFNYSELSRWQKQNHKEAGPSINARYFPPSITQDPVRSAKLNKLHDDINNLLLVEDWSQRSNATIEDSLVPQIQLAIDSGFKPQYVIFDWLELSTIKPSPNGQIDWQGYERAAMTFTKAMKKFNIAGVLFTQLTEFKGSDSCASPDSTHLSHCKKMADYMSFVICISRLKSRDLSPNPLTGGARVYAPIQYWNICKNRDYMCRSYRVNARFEVQKFESLYRAPNIVNNPV